MNGSRSTGMSTFTPNDRAESISMFFDLELPFQELDLPFPHQTLNPHTYSSPNSHPNSPTPQPAREFSSPSTTTTAKSPETAPPRGGIRVSLACIPCRSRHVKCGAEMPSCSRCTQDDKPCFYAKSRRGMRDRNASRKVTSVSPSGRSSTKGSPGPEFSREKDRNLQSNVGFLMGSEFYGGGGGNIDSSGSFGGSLSKPMSARRLIDLFYTFFYKAHPFVLPRFYFLTRLETDPSSLTYLRTSMAYIGSLYAPEVSSKPFRDLALSYLDLPSLPPTGFTVQTLLLTAIALHCEEQLDLGRAVLDRAIYLAMELGMNCTEFADAELDGVLAESWRRTYWGLYTTDSTFSGAGSAPGFI